MAGLIHLPSHPSLRPRWANKDLLPPQVSQVVHEVHLLPCVHLVSEPLEQDFLNRIQLPHICSVLYSRDLCFYECWSPLQTYFSNLFGRLGCIAGSPPDVCQSGGWFLGCFFVNADSLLHRENFLFTKICGRTLPDDKGVGNL